MTPESVKEGFSGAAAARMAATELTIRTEPQTARFRHQTRSGSAARLITLPSDKPAPTALQMQAVREPRRL